MSSVNKALIIGNLGQDPEIKYTQSGSPVANLSIATSESAFSLAMSSAMATAS